MKSITAAFLLILITLTITGCKETAIETDKDNYIENKDKNTLKGKSGDDRLHNSNTAPKYTEIHGGSGDDWLKASDNGDSLWGGSGDDTVWGGKEGDSLNGGSGDDRIYGWEGDDSLRGESGDDTLSGGIGDDWLYGGSGHNIYNFSPFDDNGTDRIASWNKGDMITIGIFHINMPYDIITENFPHGKLFFLDQFTKDHIQDIGSNQTFSPKGTVLILGNPKLSIRAGNILIE